MADQETLEDNYTLKSSMTRWIRNILPLLALPEIGDISHLGIPSHLSAWTYEFLDIEICQHNDICHNFFCLLQEILVFLWENTEHEEAELAMIGLHEEMMQTLGEEEHPECLNSPLLNDYYGRILRNEPVRWLFGQVVDLIQLSREEKTRSDEAEQLSLRSGHPERARKIKVRYMRFRLMLKEKLEEFLRKFLDVETAFNDQHN